MLAGPSVTKLQIVGEALKLPFIQRSAQKRTALLASEPPGRP
jgi:hypothetical protein